MIQKLIYADILLPDQPTPITRSFGDSIRAGGAQTAAVWFGEL